VVIDRRRAEQQRRGRLRNGRRRRVQLCDRALHSDPRRAQARRVDEGRHLSRRAATRGFDGRGSRPWTWGTGWERNVSPPGTSRPPMSSEKPVRMQELPVVAGFRLR
jgi:hypothetical protein